MRVLPLLLSIWILSATLCWAEPIPGPVTSVRIHKGVPTFFVNGEPEVTQTFETYVPNVRHFKQFAEAGCKIYGFPANCAAETWEHSRPVWVGPDVWDYSEFDENVRTILEADPDALIMPRIHVSEPQWWRDAHPGDLMVLHDGTKELKNPFRLWPGKPKRKYPSIASEKWRQDMAMCLRKLIVHIQESDYADHVFGYQVFGLSTEEWYHYTTGRPQVGDYSDHMKYAFQDWLKHKYWTEQNLRRSWNRPDIDFHEVDIPSHEERFAGRGKRVFRDPATEMHVVDFYQFYNEIVPETIDYFCGVVKEASNRSKVVGAFYAYLFEFSGNPESGQIAVQKLLESPNLDFVVVTASYGQRQLGSGGSILRSPHTSLYLHNKVWFEDNDNVSFLFPEVATRIGDAEWERSKRVLAATDNAEQTKWIYQRGAGFTLGNGAHQSFFDLHGGYFDHPQIMADVKDLYRMFENSAHHDRSSCAEILVVADELSLMYCTLYSRFLGQTMYDPAYRLIKCGAPYDAIYLNDLNRLDTSRHKLIILLNTFHMTDEQVRLVDEKLKLSGKTLFWVYAPGMFNENQVLPARVSEVTGITIDRMERDTLIEPSFQLTGKDFTERIMDAGESTAGPSGDSCDLFFVKDPQSVSLGVHQSSRKTVFASKEVEDWTSIYSITASLSPTFYRELARSADVHIYNDRNDTLYVSNSYLTLNADGAGVRTVKFPESVNVYDAVSEEQLVTAKSQLQVEFRNLETRIFRIEGNTTGFSE